MNRHLATVALMLAFASLGRGENYRFDTPSDDRWHYPFGSEPRGSASCFGSTGDPNYTTFNDRDGVFLIAWSTETLIPEGLPLRSYDVQAVRVRLTHLAATPGFPTSWPVDLTPDDWSTLDYPIADIDAGQPLELFGMGFGPTYSAVSWNEGSQFVGADEFTLVPRDPFPFVYDGNTTTKVHVEDNVKEEFTPQPWAIGVPSGYSPGHQTAAFVVNFDVNLGLSGGRVREYFQTQLSLGKVFAAVTSLQVTSMFAQTGFPTFFTKEGAPLAAGGAAPVMSITLAATGDVTGNGARDLTDFKSLAQCLDGPDLMPLATAPLSTVHCLFLFDFDEDGDVDLLDHGTFARRYP